MAHKLQIQEDDLELSSELGGGPGSIAAVGRDAHGCTAPIDEDLLPAKAFIHPYMTNTAAEGDTLPDDTGTSLMTVTELLMDDPAEGRYFLRPRKEDSSLEYILNLVYQDKPTHHLLKQVTTSEPFVLNKTTKLTSCTSLEDVRHQLIVLLIPRRY